MTSPRDAILARLRQMGGIELPLSFAEGKFKCERRRIVRKIIEAFKVPAEILEGRKRHRTIDERRRS